MDRDELDAFVLTNMPYFIAINYQQLLEAQNPQEQVTLILRIYNLGLRALTIYLVNQYLGRDRYDILVRSLDGFLHQKFHHFTADDWKAMLFNTLLAYKGNRDRFFMPELYDFYWDISKEPHRRRLDVETSFERLTQVTLEIGTNSKVPQDESGWKALSEELFGLLQHILQALSFVGKYNLILVLGKDESAYTFELHKGLSLTTNQCPLYELTLNVGSFYLRSSSNDFFLLDPWLVFGEWEAQSSVPASAIDTGIYENRGYEDLWYLLASSGQRVKGSKGIQKFMELIDIIVGRIQDLNADKLTWVDLCSICKDITKQRMTTVQDKYSKGLYLQRDKVHQKFEAFLADPKKRGFVLVGKSGVGKSNFLLAVAEELQQSRDDLCVLMYDGANLPIASSSLTEIIDKDFSDRIILSGRQVQEIWREIARIDEIDEYQVILCIDAINENSGAKELLRQLNELIQGPWPWLKIVLSSRPETWKEIKRGIKLAKELYYREQEDEVLGVELQPFSYSEQTFSYSEQMEPFSRQELPEVYSKYQRAFQLQTSYNSLTRELREILRDPLNLWLLANIHRGQKIPSEVKTSELVEQYVYTLLEREAVLFEDVRFLENQLVPLMVQEDLCSNVITEADLDRAGGGLYEKIFSAQMMSDGRRINEAFLRLVDAEILMKQVQGSEQQIVFKYERFYEYFVGKRITSLSKNQTDRYAFFLNLIKETVRTPFLWGVVRNALVREARESSFETILKLCRITHQRVKEMMVNVLNTLGLDLPKRVEEILGALIPQEKKATEWRKGRLLLGKSTEASDSIARNAGRIAIEVACSLGITWVLQRGALQEDQSLRTEAVRYSYNLWQHDQVKGFAVLESLAEQAVRGFLPNMVALESALGLSVIMFFDHYQDKAMLTRLQGIWHEIITKLLYIRQRSNHRENMVRIFIREQLISLVYRVAFWIMDSLPDYSTVTYKGLEKFFQLGATEKLLYRNLVQYLDPQGSYSEEQMKHDYLEVIKINNELLVLIAVIGLVSHACHSPHTFLPFLKKMFEETRSKVANPHLANVTKALECVLDRDPMIDEIFDFFVYTLEVSHQYYGEYPQALLTRFTEAPEAAYLGPYCLYQYQRTGTARTEWLETRIQAALSQNHIPFFDLLLSTELVHVGIELQKPLAALDALALFFNKGNVEIDRKTQSFLARLRVRYPDEVDDFLEEQHVSDDFRLQVQTNEPLETIGELIGQNAWYFIRDEVILKSPELRSQLIQIFDKAADCKDLRTWLAYFISQIVNNVYGGEALRQSKS